MLAIELQQQLKINTPSELVKLNIPELQAINSELWCKRDDLLHPIISGNKWRKLQALLMYAIKTKARCILSFGGAHSNHLHALAYCCQQLNIRFVSIVRAHKNQALSPTMRDIIGWGAELHFSSRLEYTDRTNDSLLAHYQQLFDADIVVPEGGSCTHALLGVKSMIDELKTQINCVSDKRIFDHVYAPVGSGATLAGMIKYGADVFKQVNGIAVLKGQGYLENLVEQLLHNSVNNDINRHVDSAIDNWQILHQYHHGGYAKTTSALAYFIRQFKQTHEIELETVYSAKCFFAINQLIESGQISKNSKLLAIHTGGLQGLRAQKNINV